MIRTTSWNLLLLAGLASAHALAAQTDTSRHAQVLVRAGRLLATRTV
jgi:hypothetical protein